MVWYFLICTIDKDSTSPSFQLSKPSMIEYNGDNYEEQVKNIFGRILWLLDEVQQADIDSKRVRTN